MTVYTLAEDTDLFGVDELEAWKDQIAEWWGEEQLRYDHKQKAMLFRRWWGVSKKESIELEYLSRNDNERFIERFLDNVIRNFKERLKSKGIEKLEDVRVSFRDGATATVLFGGHRYEHDVPGHAGLVGKVHYVDGSIQTVFQRFISHPFWQHSHRTGNEPSTSEAMSGQ